MRSHGGDSGAEAYEAGEPDEVSMNGFSCRSQIEHGTRREALHLAQIVRIALRDGVT